MQLTAQGLPLIPMVFLDEEAGAGRIREFPKVTQQVCGKVQHLDLSSVHSYPKSCHVYMDLRSRGCSHVPLQEAPGSPLGAQLSGVSGVLLTLFWDRKDGITGLASS